MRIIFLAITFFSSTLGFCQPRVKLYGFSQVMTKGMIIERNPSDPATKEPHASITYYLYTSSLPNVKIIPSEVWIRGQRRLLESYHVIGTPVLHADGKVLVPASGSTVRELKPGKPLPARKQAAWLQEQIDANELVFTYFWKGKKYAKALKKIRELETVFGE